MKCGVPVALMICVESVRGFQPELRATERLDRRIEVRVRADRAGDFATANLLFGLDAGARSARPNSSYISASLSPNVIGSAWTPWRAADHRRQFVPARPCRDRASQLFEVIGRGFGRSPPVAPPASCPAISDDVSPW